MKALIVVQLMSLCFFAHAQEVKNKTITQATGRDQVISIGTCSSAVAGVATGIYNSSFSKIVCREYETFQASVEGSFWNTDTSRTSESTYSYRIEQQTVSRSNYQFSSINTGNDSVDVILTALEAAALAANAVSQCNDARNVLFPLLVELNNSKCAN